MDWKKELYDEEERPLDRFVNGISHTSSMERCRWAMP